MLQCNSCVNSITTITANGAWIGGGREERGAERRSRILPSTSHPPARMGGTVTATAAAASADTATATATAIASATTTVVTRQPVRSRQHPGHSPPFVVQIIVADLRRAQRQEFRRAGEFPVLQWLPLGTAGRSRGGRDEGESFCDVLRLFCCFLAIVLCRLPDWEGRGRRHTIVLSSVRSARSSASRTIACFVCGVWGGGIVGLRGGGSGQCVNGGELVVTRSDRDNMIVLGCTM